MSIDPIDRLREFLRISTVSSTGVSSASYRKAGGFLADLMTQAGIEQVQQTEFVPGKPVVTGLIRGDDVNVGGLLLSGHYDVVPAEINAWKHGPFDGQVEDGRIIGRGAQDMKSVLIQYIEAARVIKQKGSRRNIYFSLFPDEEVGGRDGAQVFIESSLFRSMNIEVVLDEGLANPGDAFSLFYGERAINYVRIIVRGATGHGSRFVENSAVEKITKILSNIYSFRSEQQSDMRCNCKKLGDVLTVNVTGLKAGVDGLHNVVPSEAELIMDVRVPLHVNDLEGLIRKEFLRELEEGIEIEFIQKTNHPHENDLEGKWLKLIESTFNNLSIPIEKEIFPAATDSRFFRKIGLPCFGFSPIRNTPILLHDHNEFIFEKGFLKGIDIYVELIQTLANA